MYIWTEHEKLDHSRVAKGHSLLNTPVTNKSKHENNRIMECIYTASIYCVPSRVPWLATHMDTVQSCSPADTGCLLIGLAQQSSAVGLCANHLVNHALELGS